MHPSVHPSIHSSIRSSGLRGFDVPCLHRNLKFVLSQLTPSLPLHSPKTQIMPLFGRHRARDDANVTARRRGWALFPRKNRAYYAPTLTDNSPLPIEHTPPPPGSSTNNPNRNAILSGRTHDANMNRGSKKAPRRIVRTHFLHRARLPSWY
jgi:hypothetical protein